LNASGVIIPLTSAKSIASTVVGGVKSRDVVYEGDAHLVGDVVGGSGRDELGHLLLIGDLALSV
jgi:hypothetical protein